MGIFRLFKSPKKKMSVQRYTKLIYFNAKVLGLFSLLNVSIVQKYLILKFKANLRVNWLTRPPGDLNQ